MCYLCEKFYIPITVQYYIADCVSWVPRLTLLDLQSELMTALSKQNSFVCRGLLYYSDVCLRMETCICMVESL